MHKFIFTTVAVLPLLLPFSHAAQSWSVDPQPTPFGIPSEETGTSAYLGVDVSDVTTDRLETLKLKEEKGVEVTMVDQDAPAGKAGLKEHDVIMTMNGEPLESGAQLRRMIHETPAGRQVTLGVSRDGQPLTIKVQLGDRHKEFSYLAPKAKDFHFDIPPIPNMQFEMPEVNVVVVHSSVRTGLMVENMTPQLGEYFGIKNGSGVLIRSVEKGSRGEKAGFRAGDVVMKVNGQAVHDTGDFTHALRSGSGAIGVSVMRDKREQNLNLTLPEHKDSGEIFEDSSPDPGSGADIQLDLGDVNEEIAEIRPEIKWDLDQAKAYAAEAQKTWCAQQKQMRRQVDKLQKDLPRIQRDLKRDQKKMEIELDKAPLDI
jgi:serine protease Do